MNTFAIHLFDSGQRGLSQSDKDWIREEIRRQIEGFKKWVKDEVAAQIRRQ